MPFTHDEKKIEEILSKYGEYDRIGSYFAKEDGNIEKAMKEYASHIRTQTLEEAKGCVPEFKVNNGYLHEYETGYNKCREQTLTNLNLLDK